MMSKRYLALLTSAAMTTTLVVPTVNAQETAPNPVVQPENPETTPTDQSEATVAENQGTGDALQVQPTQTNPAGDFTVPTEETTVAAGANVTGQFEVQGAKGDVVYNIGAKPATWPAGLNVTTTPGGAYTVTATANVAPARYAIQYAAVHTFNGGTSNKGGWLFVNVTEQQNLAENYRLLDENASVAAGGTTTGEFDVEGAEGTVVHNLGDKPADWPVGLEVTVNQDGTYTITATPDVAPGRYSIMHWARHTHTNGQQSVRGAWLFVNVTEPGETPVPPVDEDEDGSSVGGSSLPLLIGLGLAGSALAGSAILSSAGGSAVADGSASPAGSGAQGDGAANEQTPAQGNQQAPAADAANVEDPKAVAQAQAANAKHAPAQKQAPAQAHAKAAPAQKAQTAHTTHAAQQQRQLANTGVEGTLIALVAGLLAVSAGVLLLLRRRA